MKKNVSTRMAVPSDLDRIKALADEEKHSLGFITRGTLKEAIANAQVMLVLRKDVVVGFQHFYHRKRDRQTTLYHKTVDKKFRRRGYGRVLVDAVVEQARELKRETLILKCPADLPANDFHKSYGFKLVGTEKGKRRRLKIWRYDL